MIKITKPAKEHFKSLLAQEGIPNLRIFTTHPHTEQAEIGISYCTKEDEIEDDTAIAFEDFTLFIEKSSLEALKEACIDYEQDELEGGQIAIKAPYLKESKQTDPDHPLLAKIQKIVDNEINPSLASHGGQLSLVGLDENGILQVRLSGGCQGCSLAAVTLKQGVEKTLKAKFSELTAIEDITQHQKGENPYA